MTKYNKFMETTGVDISSNGYAWKDDRGPGAGKDPVIDKAKDILKAQSPETFQALVNDKDNPNDVGDSDLVRGQAASEDGTNLPDSSVNVKANGQRLGYVDTAKGQFIKEALDNLDKSLTTIIESVDKQAIKDYMRRNKTSYLDDMGMFDMTAAAEDALDEWEIPVDDPREEDFFEAAAELDDELTANGEVTPLI